MIEINLVSLGGKQQRFPGPINVRKIKGHYVVEDIKSFRVRTVRGFYLVKERTDES